MVTVQLSQKNHTHTKLSERALSAWKTQVLGAVKPSANGTTEEVH